MTDAALKTAEKQIPDKENPGKQFFFDLLDIIQAGLIAIFI